MANVTRMAKDPGEGLGFPNGTHKVKCIAAEQRWTGEDTIGDADGNPRWVDTHREIQCTWEGEVDGAIVRQNSWQYGQGFEPGTPAKLPHPVHGTVKNYETVANDEGQPIRVPSVTNTEAALSNIDRLAKSVGMDEWSYDPDNQDYSDFVEALKNRECMIVVADGRVKGYRPISAEVEIEVEQEAQIDA